MHTIFYRLCDLFSHYFRICLLVLFSHLVFSSFPNECQYQKKKNSEENEKNFVFMYHEQKIKR